MPEELYEALAERARVHRRSLAQQAMADLERIPELEARRERLAAIEKIRNFTKVASKGRLDPVKIIREDRKR